MPEVPVSGEADCKETERVLTRLPEQQDVQLLQFTSVWHHPAFDGPIARQEVEAAISRCCKMASLKNPTVLWCESPFQMVAMRVLLALKIFEFPTLCNALSAELNDFSWRRMWQKLQEQQEHLRSPLESDSIVAEAAHGLEHWSDFDRSQIHMKMAEKVSQAEIAFECQLSLPVKLRLREIFIGSNTDGPLRASRSPLIRERFGMLNFRAFLSDDAELVAQLWRQLSEESSSALTELCSAQVPAPDPGLRQGQAQQLEMPGKDAFVRLFRDQMKDVLESPSTTHNFMPVAFVIKHLSVMLDDDLILPLRDWLTVKENVFHSHYSPSANVLFLCESPIRANLNERSQLHNEHGPAIEFRDGTSVYAWNGVVVPNQVVEKSGEITIEQIDKESNIEVRRVLIQQYGLAKYLEDSGAVKIDEDAYGVLYKKVARGDEPIVVVRVTNPTPEPDGSCKLYFLRVPPYITTAHAAVAWTFNLKPEEYEPAAQT